MTAGRASIPDLVSESVHGVTGRPGRAALTGAGVALGVAAMVATVGLSSTASAHVARTFDSLKPTEVSLVDGTPDAADALAPDAEQRVRQVDGVVAGGTWWHVELVAGRGATALRGRQPTSVGVAAVDAGAFEAMGPDVDGAGFEPWHHDVGAPVALVAAGAARDLGVHRPVDPAAAQVIWVDGRTFTVIGVLDDVERAPELLTGLVVPAETARRLWPDAVDGAVRLIVETERGAAATVAEQLPLALRPHDPDRFLVAVPPEPERLRSAVESGVAAILLGLAAVSLVIGAVGIANTTLVSVLERTPEIGLRRAIGARRRDIVVQFLAEAGTLGLAGGAVGTALGVLVVAGVSIARGWVAVVDPRLVPVALLVGGVTGVVAGAYPARRAASTRPLEALRQ